MWTSTGVNKIIEITWNLYYGHGGLKLGIDNKKITEKSPHS